MKCMQFVIFICVSIGHNLTTHAAARSAFRTTTKEMPCSAPTTAQTAARTVLSTINTKDISAVNRLFHKKHPTDIRHEIIRILVQEVGIDPNLLQDRVIFDAVEHSNEELTQLLITARADVNLRDTGYYIAPLCFAQTVPIAQLLLTAGADAHVTDYDGGSLLHNVVRTTGKNANLIPLYVTAGTVTDWIRRSSEDDYFSSIYRLDSTRNTPIIMLLDYYLYRYWDNETNKPYDLANTLQIIHNLVLAGAHFSFKPTVGIYRNYTLAKILIERINEKITQEKKAFLRILQREIVTTARAKRRLLLESAAHLPIQDVANRSHYDVPKLITEYSDCSTEDLATFDVAEAEWQMEYQHGTHTYFETPSGIFFVGTGNEPSVIMER